MKNLLKYFEMLILLACSSNLLFAQLQLVGSFEEMNKMGHSYFGRVVRSAGDVNGDGYNDIIVGAPNYGNAAGHMGSAYLYFGGAPMDTVADLIFRGEQIDDNFGCSVSGAGDVNGDGYDDIIIGAYGAGSSTYDGKAYIYFGGAAMDTDADVVLYGHNGDGDNEWENGSFAISVASAGDFNGDGYDDVLIGSSDYENDDISYDYTGGVHLFYGGANMDATRDLLFVGENDGDKFGRSVASAGDVNNDGYPDIIIGAYSADKAYIYLGGANPDTTADLVLTDNDGSGYSEFGFSVSGAGDVNGDNYDDIIIGNYNQTSAYIYYGGSTLDATADVNLVYTGGRFGISVSTAGDVNNDGYDDVIVGDDFNYDNNTKGHAYIYFGSSSMDNVPDISFSEGVANYSSFGRFVAYAGDINNDGYSDIVVGEDDDTYSSGSAYVYLGGQSMDNYTDVHLSGEGTGNSFGDKLTSGDFNGDGYPDIAVSAPSYNNGDGRVYIYLGGTNADSLADIIISGNGNIASAGDVNNDGFDDLIIAATSENNYTGAVYLYFGGNPMDSQHDFIYQGTSQYQYFGSSLSSAGDVNGDGYDDIIIGTGGSTYANIYFGGVSLSNTPDVHLTDGTVDNFGRRVSNAGDVNNDGYDDVMVYGNHYGYYNNLGRVLIYFGGSSMDATADVGISGQSGYDYFGNSLSPAGDINGDGYDDIIIGAREYNYDGRAYIYFGGSPMNSTADVVLDAESAGDDFGDVVSGIGDINNDTYDDVLVGASTFYVDSHHTSMGKAYIYYGGPSMDTTPEYTFMDYSSYYTNSAPVYASSVGDFYGDGSIEFMVSNYDHIANGMVFLYTDLNATLPVELKTFNASINNGAISLSWQTATEVNNYGFEVQRAKVLSDEVNNIEYKKIGFVQGHGNSSSPKLYSFTDNSDLSGKYIYRLKQIDVNGQFEYSDAVEVNVETPEKFELSQNYPNPFNPSTIIKFGLPEQSKVRLTVYNSLGEEVIELLNENMPAGHHQVKFDGSNLSSGLYFYKISTNNYVAVKKMMLMK